MRKLRLIVVIVLALSAMLVAAPTASADDHECRVAPVGSPPEEINPPIQPIYDNVIVPTGWICVLVGAEVHGNVLAQPDSELFISGLFEGEEGQEELVAETVIGGNVEVKEGALTGAFFSTIRGNYKCDNCFFEDVINTTVGGNVEVVGSDDGDFVIESVIRGNLHISESDAGNFAFVVAGTTIDGSLIFEKNVGFTDISFNDIGGNLQIYENNVCPPDVDPSECFLNGFFNDNTVGGNMQVYKNQGPTEISRNAIVQNLQCFDNQPPPVGAGNTYRKAQGQCRVLPPPPEPPEE